VAQGVKVYLVVLTSGQDGVTAHAKIPAGAQLGAVREAESRAACKAYGIEEPFLFGEQDGSLASMQHNDHIIHRLEEIIQTVQPSVIITFGPDGITGTPTIGL
jgi:LmbE family N-acetylglucosaminyl deacetylase